MSKTSTPIIPTRAKTVKKTVVKKEKKTAKTVVNKISIAAPIISEEPIAPVIQIEIPAAEKIKTRVFDFVIFGSLFLIFLLCPLFFTGLSGQGVIFEKVILFYFLVLIGAAAWAVKMAVRGEINFKRTVLDLPILGVLAIFIISTIVSVNQRVSLTGSGGNSTKGLIALIVFILFYYLIVNNTDAKKIKILFWALIFSFSAMFVYSLLQILGIFVLPFGFTQTASFIPTGSLFSLSKLIIISLPILILTAVFVVKDEAEKKTGRILLKWVLVAMSLIGFIILAMLNNITFWPAGLAGMAVALFLILLKKIKVSQNNLIIPITAFLLLVIFLVLGNFNIGNTNIANEAALSYGESWSIAKNSLKENPLLGSGPATFYYDFSKFKSVDFNMSQFWNNRFAGPSGFLFDALSSVGALGTLAFLIVITVSLIILWRSIFEDYENEVKNLLSALFSSLIVIAVIALFSPFNDYLIMISIIIFGLAYAARVVGEKNAREINIVFQITSGKNYLLTAFFIAVVASIAAMFVFNVKVYLADFYMGRALAAESLNGQLENLNKAVKFAPNQDIYRINLANSLITSVNQAAAKEAANKNEILNNLNESVKQARVAVEIAPEKAANNEFLALIYENAASYEGLSTRSQNIKDAYGEVIKLEPNNPVPYYKLALLNVAEAGAEKDENLKNSLLDQAVVNYDKAISLKSDLAAAYYGKGIVSEQKNDLNGAIDGLKIAVEKSGGNIDYAFELGRLYLNRGSAKAEPAEPSDNTENIEDNPSASSGQVKRNEDINIANQIFLSILQVENNHSNALYSLALIYQSVGEPEDMKIAVDRLLSIITDENQKEKIKQQFNIE